MKIDKEKVKTLCALPDEELWAQIVSIGKEHGFTLPKSVPPHSEMQKLRDAVNGSTKMNLSAALRIIDNHRKSAK